MMNNNRAFTLVELIVTISILAILTTFGFFYLEENLGDTRDSKRLADMGSFEKNLDIYKTQQGSYPDPDNAVAMLYSGSTVWTQGTFGTEVNRTLKVFGNEYPLDPQFGNEYSYSVTNSNSEYQMATIIENIDESEDLLELQSLFIPQVSADTLPTAYTVGNYNGFMVHSEVAGEMTFIATPSITTTDITDTDVISAITNRKLVYSEFFNLPGIYSNYTNVDGGFFFNVTDPVIFTGSLADLQNEDNLQNFATNLKYIYATTPTESFDKYIALLEQDGLNTLKSFLIKTFRLQLRGYFNCFDILEAGESQGDGNYTIDPDGDGGSSPYEVYCDMTTDEGGWTRVGDNHVTGGDFSTGGIVTESGSTPTNTRQSMSTPIASGYGIYQTGDSTAAYEIGVDDISQFQPGYEIRMYAWVKDEDDGGWTSNINSQAGYMFNNRIFYSDSTSSVGGTLETISTSGDWTYQRVRHKILKPLDDFRWYIGYGAEDTRNLYFTGVSVELFYR